MTFNRHLKAVYPPCPSPGYVRSVYSAWTEELAKLQQLLENYPTRNSRYRKGIKKELALRAIIHTLISMLFEFDPEKSAKTKADPNRQIDFVEAQQIWEDPEHVEIPLPFTAECRWAVIGRWKGKLWTAIITKRGDRVRVISVRRAHKQEETIYEKI